jgi:hypothetical protein
MPLTLPLRITRLDACFVIRDANGINRAYFYFENDLTRANILKMPPETEARELAQRFARSME